MAKLVFGCGYLGLRVARLWKADGHTVYAATRDANRASELAREGLQPLILDLTADQPIAVPQDVQTVLFAVGYDRKSGKSIHEVYAGGLKRALAALPATVDRIIYISSTGVYGHVASEWVNENSPCQPIREGGAASLAAENVLKQHPLGAKGIVLRLAGIYGPLRIPRAADLSAGKPIDAPAEGTLNLIHVDDAARIVLLAEKPSTPSQLYVVSDGHPMVRREYYEELARLLHAPPPTFVDPDPSSPAAQRATSDKRIDNRRLRDELQPTFLYPSYREGLRAILQQPTQSR